MATNVVSRPVKILEVNNEIAGLNKVKYRPYGSRLAASGNAIDHWSGKLELKTLVQLTYDAMKGSFDKPLGEALTPATTELAQASAKVKSFSYTRTPIHVEITISNIQDIPKVNIQAGLIRELDQQWDRMLFQGGLGNSALWELPETHIIDSSVMLVDDYFSISEVVGGLFNKVAATHGAEPPAGQVTLSFSPDVMAVLRRPVQGFKTTGIALMRECYQGVEIESVPYGIGLPDHISLAYRPFIKVHHGLLPEVYSEQIGSHGLMTSILLVFETPAFELEDDGAYVYQRVTTK